MMTPVLLNTPEGPSLGQGGQNQFFNSPNNQDTRAFFDPRRQTIEISGGLRDQNDPQDHKLGFHDGSYGKRRLFKSSFPSPQPVMHDPRTARGPHRVSYCRMEAVNSIKSGHGSAKWTSSKMRLMKKMMRPSSSSSATHKAINATPSPRVQNHGHGNKRKYSQRSPRNNTTRVCSTCETTTTPLWRSGPLGPKSLCNACGIRLRKARRAEEAKKNLATPMKSTSRKKRVHNKEKKPSTNHGKSKRYKVTTDSSTASSSSSSESAEENLECFAATSSRNNSEFKQTFAWDVTMVKAALHLIHMSCQLVNRS